MLFVQIVFKGVFLGLQPGRYTFSKDATFSGCGFSGFQTR